MTDTAAYLDPHAKISLPVSPVRRIINEVAAKHHVRPHHLRPGSRVLQYVRARQEAAYRCYAETTAGFSAIARALGGFDHATVVYGAQRHAYVQGLPLPRKLKPLPVHRAPRRAP